MSFLDTLRSRKQIINLQGREYVTHEGLLALAVEQGLTGVTSTLLNYDADRNQAIVQATATGERGTYSDIGDASPQNVGKMIANACIRMASTRAISRSLRLYCGIGMTAYDELPPEATSTRSAPAPRPAQAPVQASPPAEGDHIPEGCPKCGKEMWDNRVDKRNARAPDFKCKDKACGEAIWIDTWLRANPAPTQAADPDANPDHHPSWDADRASFCATVGETCGTSYEPIADWCEREGWGRPSSWPKAGRDSFLADLANGKTTPLPVIEEIPF